MLHKNQCLESAQFPAEAYQYPDTWIITTGAFALQWWGAYICAGTDPTRFLVELFAKEQGSFPSVQALYDGTLSKEAGIPPHLITCPPSPA
jgi:hypothetical protein